MLRVTGDRPLLHRDIGFLLRLGIPRRNNAPSPPRRIPERALGFFAVLCAFHGFLFFDYSI